MTALERKARDLCAQAGTKPDKLLKDYGPGGGYYRAWELYRELAKEKLAPRSKHGVRLDQ